MRRAEAERTLTRRAHRRHVERVELIAEEAELRRVLKKLLLRDRNLVVRVESQLGGDFTVLWKGQTDPDYVPPEVFSP